MGREDTHEEGDKALFVVVLLCFMQNNYNSGKCRRPFPDDLHSESTDFFLIGKVEDKCIVVNTQPKQKEIENLHPT